MDEEENVKPAGDNGGCPTLNTGCGKQDDLALYKYWLRKKKEADKKNDSNFVEESIQDTYENSPAYQEDSERNDVLQPMVITRKDAQKAEAMAMPGDELYIGDMVKAFDEMWICVSAYIDEFGVTHGELWICNYLLRFQNGTPDIIERYVVIDDGSYSKSGEDKIPVVDDSYNLYITLDDDTKWLYIDKRLAIGQWVDKDKKSILEVVKIRWIDVRTRNLGAGSHILFMGIVGDLYNEGVDNFEERICDYIASEETTEPPVEPQEKQIYIDGKETIRIGTKRTYELYLDDGSISDTQTELEVEENRFAWSISGDVAAVAFEESADGMSCTIQVPLDDSLIGKSVTLTCKDTLEEYATGTMSVGVINLG